MLNPTTAEWAGVSFDANPVTLDLAEVVINAAPGIGEALVSGEVNPEEILVDRTTRHTRRHHVPSGQRAMPTSWIPIIAAETSRISEAFGFPQDVEWAVADNQLFVLQSRPITTITEVFVNRSIEPWRDNSAARPAEAERLWSRAYADDIWAPPVSPLFYCVQNLTPSFASYWRWHDESSELPPDVFKYHDACAYVDVDALRRQYAHHPRLARIEGVLSFFPPDLRDAVATEKFEWKGRLRRTLRFELQDRRTRSLAHNHRTLSALWPDFITTSDQWFDRNLDDLTVGELRAHHSEIQKVVSVVSPACGFAVAYHAHDLTFILTGLLQRWFGEGDRLYALVSGGLDNSATVAEASALWRLGQLFRQCVPSALNRTPAPSWEDLRAELHNFEAGHEAVREFEAFWRSHRHRGASYKDLVFDRWGDDVDRLLRSVLIYASSNMPDPRTTNATSAALRRQEQDQLLTACRGIRLWRRPLLSWLFRYNEIYMSERDNHRYYFDRVWYQLRRIYRSYGRRLVSTGVLEQVDDIFFLGTNEIDDAMAATADVETLRFRISVRRSRWTRTRDQLPARYLRGYSPYAGESQSPHDRSLRGIPASPGQIVGPARVVRSMDELDQIAPGEILVTQQTDPAWSIAFPLIAGLVLETGGVLAHGASLCREYSLPCVTACEGAMSTIVTGTQIRVDGTNGRVEILGVTDS
jgi:rifampicin phosphotransferase